jgi:hypothetical protein
MGLDLNAAKRVSGFFLLLAAVFVYLSLSPEVGQTGQATKKLEITPAAPIPGALYRFAVIGDYGDGSDNEARVAALVASWNPDFVITTGDNNYLDGEASTIDDNIGQYYSAFIGNYTGAYGPGSPTNRFWPSLGNHDWDSMGCDASDCSGPYLDYFTLPGNERYFDVDFGLLHLYALDSDTSEPDGAGVNSPQASWLQGKLAASDSCFDVVYFHLPPYSSGQHGSIERMRWPFAGWGADVVLSGHDHSYERLDVGGLAYIVNGLGGRSLYGFPNVGELPPGVTSHVRYNDDYGAMLVTVAENSLTAQFYKADGALIDQYTVEKECDVALWRLYAPSVMGGVEK